MRKMSELQRLKESVDLWTKDINSRVQNIEQLAKILKETIDNTEHTYELVLEKELEIEELKREVKMLKIITMTMLKKPQNKNGGQKLCRHCGGDMAIRNPTGWCDHLHYPEACTACQRILKLRE